MSGTPPRDTFSKLTELARIEPVLAKPETQSPDTVMWRLNNWNSVFFWGGGLRLQRCLGLGSNCVPNLNLQEQGPDKVHIRDYDKNLMRTYKNVGFAS